MTVLERQLSTRIPLQNRLDCQQSRFVRRRPPTVKSWVCFSCAMTTCEQLPRLSWRCWSFFKAPTKLERIWHIGIAMHWKGRFSLQRAVNFSRNKVGAPVLATSDIRCRICKSYGLKDNSHLCG